MKLSFALAALLLGAAPAKARPTAALPERIQAAMDEGSKAAQEGRWPDAAAAYAKAELWAFAHPLLLHDLGVAHDRMGHRAAAAHWWRAYLTLVPQAADAAALELKIARTAAELDLRGRAQLQRGFEAASVLSARRAPGGRSLRRKALNDVLRDAYYCGPQSLGDALRARARRLASADPEPDDIQALRTAGAIRRATYSMDDERARHLRAKLTGGDAAYYDAEMAYMYARMGRPADAARSLSAPGVHSETVVDTLLSQGAFASAEPFLAEALAKEEPFNGLSFVKAVREAEEGFWRADRAAAIRLAQAALAQIDRFNPPLDAHYNNPPVFYGRLAALAMTSNWQEFDRLMRLNEKILAGYPDRWLDRIIPLAAANDASKAGHWRSRIQESSGMYNSPGNFAYQFFVSAAGLDFAAGSDGPVLEYIGRVNSSPDSSEKLVDVLTMAARYGRVEPALAASNWIESGSAVAEWLRVLAQNTSGSARDRAWAQLKLQYGGLEPLSREGELRLFAQVLMARWASKDLEQFNVVPKNFDEVLAKTPESLPGTLSGAACLNLLTADALLHR